MHIIIYALFIIVDALWRGGHSVVVGNLPGPNRVRQKMRARKYKIENSIWLGAENDKSRNKEPCARINNRASFAVSFGQGRNDIVEYEKQKPFVLFGGNYNRIATIDFCDNIRIFLLCSALKTVTFLISETSRRHASREGRAFFRLGYRV